MFGIIPIEISNNMYQRHRFFTNKEIKVQENAESRDETISNQRIKIL